MSKTPETLSIVRTLQKSNDLLLMKMEIDMAVETWFECHENGLDDLYNQTIPTTTSYEAHPDVHYLRQYYLAYYDSILKHVRNSSRITPTASTIPETVPACCALPCSKSKEYS